MPLPQAFPDRLAAPSFAQVGRYAIVRRLAVGGMAEVYLARVRGPHGFARQVVLKRIRPELARTGQYQRMFAGEARIAAHLHHVNIAQVIDVGEEDGEPFLVMEYVEGRDVHALLADAGERGLPVHVAVAIALGVAAGLDHAHERRDADGRPLGIVHRDVSPSNVMVGFDGNVKLLDFGVAKAQGARDVTRAGTVKGKAEYMSPEQALGLAVDRKSDLFSLGTMLYELLVGVRPFDDGPVLVPPGRRRDGIPPALDALVIRLLAHEAARRPASAEEVSTALDAIARDERLSSPPVALRRYLRERFGEPEPAGDEDDPTFDEERPATATATAGAPVTGTAPITSVDELPAESPPLPPVPRRRRLLVLALAVAVAMAAMVPVLVAGGETRSDAAPRPAAAPVPVAAPVPIALPLPPEPAPVPEAEAAPAPTPEVPSPRPPVRRRPPVVKTPAPAPAPGAPAWDPDSPLLRSQARRLRP